MHLQRILAIGRAERFSPNSVGKDAAILESVCRELALCGYDIEMVSETGLDGHTGADAYITMGRCRETLCRLNAVETCGGVVVNPSEAVALCCNRRRLTAVLRQAGVCVPPEEGAYGYWLKRADGVAEGPGDVRFAAGKAEREEVMADMRRHGVTDILVTAHIKGDLVKFYGVRGSRFFRIFYPGDDRQWKFGDEMRNGLPQHYHFSVTGLQAMAEQAAAATGTDIYGGDCIVQADGSVCIIDFNDWPSFSRCRDEAAKAIATRIDERIRWQTAAECEKKM